MKIALVIPGRFHGFDLARALIASGHDVTVLTNYPRWGTRRFGLPDDRVVSFTGHGLATRAVSRLPMLKPAAGEARLHQAFGRWAARMLSRERWDVVHGWSGVSEEWLTSPLVKRDLALLMRGSAHIAAQADLLEAEERRLGQPLDRPSEWKIARETREYRSADAIRVLSTFSRRTFIERGVPAENVWLLPPGADTATFRPADEVLRARQTRIRGGAPLRILFVGTLSARKGVIDLVDAIRRLPRERFDVHLVGDVLEEARDLVSAVGDRVTCHGRVAQSALPAHYWNSDVFFFPTIEDGFAVVLAQAKAAGLPVVATPHCAAPDLIEDGVDGWLVPVRDGQAAAARLVALDEHRDQLAAAAELASTTRQPGTWPAAVESFVRACQERSSQRVAEA